MPKHQTAKQALLDRLRARLARLDHGDRADRPILPFGLAAVDRALPGGGLRARLPARAVRRAGSGGGRGLRRGAAGACWRPTAMRSGSGRGTICSRRGSPRSGLPPERLIVVRARSARRPPLGARGSAAQPGPHGGAGRGRPPDPDPEPAAAARRRGQGRDRLSAAAAGGVRCAERGAERRHDPLADHAAVRLPQRRCVAASWERPRWRVELVRCRGGRTGVWQVAWREGGWHEITDALALAAEPGDRPAAQAPASAPGKRARSGELGLRPTSARSRPSPPSAARSGSRRSARCARAAGLRPA